MNTFGKRLKAARNARDVSQSELGLMTEKHQSVISQLESNGRKPSMDTLANLCDTLNVSSDYLLGRTDSMLDSKLVDSKTSDTIRHYAKLSKEQQDVFDILLKVLVRAQDRTTNRNVDTLETLNR